MKKEILDFLNWKAGFSINDDSSATLFSENQDNMDDGIQKLSSIEGLKTEEILEHSTDYPIFVCECMAGTFFALIDEDGVILIHEELKFFKNEY
jgi:hypothetical protein